MGEEESKKVPESGQETTAKTKVEVKEEKKPVLTEEDVVSYYSRKDVQNAILESAKDREVGTRFLAGGFGKRPDILVYPQDILAAAKQGVSSFHMSEERWSNALALNTGMKKKEVDELRKGWDLIIDIDCPYWTISRMTAWLIVHSLKAHGISSMTAKFSGNKGFHIAVPWEAFPRQLNGTDTASLFPDAARNLALYLLDYIKKPENNMITVVERDVIFGNAEIGKYKVSLDNVMEKTGKKFDELTIGKNAAQKKRTTTGGYFCRKCGHFEPGEETLDYKICKRCGYIMDFEGEKKEMDATREFNPLAIVEVDTVLISSRHLFRSVYSLNEKSGLASIPINPMKILDFRKVDAHPRKITFGVKFLDRKNVKADEARMLIEKAYDFAARKTMEKEKKDMFRRDYVIKKGEQEFKDVPKIEEEFFCPTIKKILGGMEDGRKRAVFILINFLTSVGWSYEEVEARLTEWNKKNQEPLRENIIVGQLNYHKAQKKKVLPPNYDAPGYYKDMGVYVPDPLTEKLKNPVNYAIIRKRSSLENMKEKPAKEKSKQKLEKKEKDMSEKK